jgi:hypothetical protein
VRNESCRAHPSIRIVRGAVDLAIFGRLSIHAALTRISWTETNPVRHVWKKVWGLRLYRTHAACFSKL